jgi:branched-chain amino acid transport system substrate-binding protein
MNEMQHRAALVHGLSVVVSSMALLLTVLVGASVSAGATTKATGTPLVIGTIETVTGSSQCSNCRVTAATDTLNAWVKQVNAAGGIGGHPVQLVALNDDADPGQAQTDLAKLQSDNALAIVGEDASVTEPGWGATITKDGLPVIGGTAYSTNWITNPLFYPGTVTPLSAVWGIMYAASKAVKQPKLGSVLCNSASVCLAAQPLEVTAAKSLHLPIVYSGTVSPTATDYTPQCLAMKAAGANVVAPEGVNQELLVKDCARQGYHPVVVTGDLQPIPNQVHSDPQLAGLVGPAGSFVPYQGFSAEKGYFAMLKKYAPQYLPGGTGYDGTYWMDASTNAYVAAEAFQKAIENADVPAGTAVTRADLIKGLSMFKDETLGGITPPLTYGDGTKPNPGEPCFYLYKTANNKQVFEPIPSNKMTYYCEPQSDLP